MDGILLVDKPKGWTSFDVVAKVRSTVRAGLRSQQPEDGQNQAATSSRKVKVGHTGTLDPLATGLLVLLLGRYTKQAPMLTKLDKTYEVTMRLGMTSTTGDEEGEKTESNEKRTVSLEELDAALLGFVGDSMQTPPKYSAVKINGQRAYKLARTGKEVKLEPRPITVHSIELTEYTYPLVRFTTEVSSGTYIRTLVEDIGETLGTGAYMSDLRRTRVGTYQLADAIELTDTLATDIIGALHTE